MRILEADEDHLTLQVDLDRLLRERVYIEGIEHELLGVSGGTTTSERGRPAMPAIGLLIGIPWDAVDVYADDPVAVKTRLLEQVLPAPFRAPLIDTFEPEPYVRDRAAYADYTPYPEQTVEVGAPAVWRDYRVVRVEVRPLQTVTALEQVLVAESTLVTLRFVRSGNGASDDPGAGTGTPMDGAYASTINNFETATARERSDSALDYLAIVSDDLEASLMPLLDHHLAAGRRIQVVRTSEIGAMLTPDLVREKIAAIYATDHPQFVLLAGDPARIPLHHYPDGTFSAEVPSDAFYAFLEGDDLLADVAIGRLPASTPEEMALLVGKTLAYAQGDPLDPWRKKMVHVAHKENYPEKYSSCVRSIVERDFGRPVEWQTLYGGEGATNVQLTEALNAGVGVVSYRGHGDVKEWDAWGADGKYVASEQPIANGAMTPVVFSVACSTAAIEQEGSLAEQFLLRSEGGAVAFLGATEPSGTLANHDFARGLFNALLERDVHAIGILSNEANAAVVRQFGTDETAMNNVRMYLWLGDPGLEIGAHYACAPAPAEAGADATLAAGSSTTLGPTTPVAQATYSWSPAEGLSCTSCAQPVATPLTTTTYTVTVETACRKTSDSVVVTIAAETPIDAAPPAPADAAPTPPPDAALAIPDAGATPDATL